MSTEGYICSARASRLARKLGWIRMFIMGASEHFFLGLSQWDPFLESLTGKKLLFAQYTDKVSSDQFEEIIEALDNICAINPEDGNVGASNVVDASIQTISDILDRITY